jgi:hypothetical protein
MQGLSTTFSNLTLGKNERTQKTNFNFINKSQIAQTTKRGRTVMIIGKTT